MVNEREKKKKKVKEKRDEVSLELRVVTLGVDWDVEVVTDSGCSFCKDKESYDYELYL